MPPPPRWVGVGLAPLSNICSHTDCAMRSGWRGCWIIWLEQWSAVVQTIACRCAEIGASAHIGISLVQNLAQPVKPSAELVQSRLVACNVMSSTLWSAATLRPSNSSSSAPLCFMAVLYCAPLVLSLLLDPPMSKLWALDPSFCSLPPPAVKPLYCRARRYDTITLRTFKSPYYALLQTAQYA